MVAKKARQNHITLSPGKVYYLTLVGSLLPFLHYNLVNNGKHHTLHLINFAPKS